LLFGARPRLLLYGAIRRVVGCVLDGSGELMQRQNALDRGLAYRGFAPGSASTINGLKLLDRGVSEAK
jgi:hypothetical protein